MELSNYLAGESSVTLDEDPGSTWTSTIETTEGEVEITTDVGSTFEAWTLAYQEVAFLDDYFDGDIMSADKEEVSEQSRWGPLDDEYIEHVQETIEDGTTDDIPFELIDALTIEDLQNVYGRIIQHATARVTNGAE